MDNVTTLLIVIVVVVELEDPETTHSGEFCDVEAVVHLKDDELESITHFLFNRVTKCIEEQVNLETKMEWK